MRSTWDWATLQRLALLEARRYVDAETARDAAQEAIVRAWRRASTCSGQPEPWVRTIARREALRLASRRGHDPIPARRAVLDENEDRLAAQRVDVMSALAVLSEDEKTALLLRYWADRTEHEIAYQLNAPVGTIKIRLHRARAKLAARLAAG